MSLVSTYVLADDGKWYKDPVLEAADHSWFICFDDDDPPELVFKVNGGESKKDWSARASLILANIGIRIHWLRPSHASGRCFGPEEKVHDAMAYWIDIIAPIPKKWITRPSEGSDKKPDCQGVFYNFSNFPPEE